MEAEATDFSHSVNCSPQHATAIKCRLRRTAGQTRFNDLAIRADKLPGCTIFTLI
jgi:hypothetical protein